MSPVDYDPVGTEAPRFNDWATFRGKRLGDMDKDELLAALAWLHWELRECYKVMKADQMAVVSEKIQARGLSVVLVEKP